MFRRGDGHVVDVRNLQHLAVIGEGVLGLDAGGPFFGAFFPAVGDGDGFEVVRFLQVFMGVEMIGAHPAGSDKAHANPRVRPQNPAVTRSGHAGRRQARGSRRMEKRPPRHIW